MRTIGKYGSIAAFSSARDCRPAEHVRLRRRIRRPRTLRVVGTSGPARIGRPQEPKLEDGGRAHRAAQSTSFGPLGVMITLPGLRSVPKPVAGRQTIDQREDFGGDVLRELAIVVPQLGLHILAHGDDLRPRAFCESTWQEPRRSHPPVRKSSRRFASAATRVGPSSRCRTMPKRPSRVTSPPPAGAPTAWTARIMRTSNQAIRRGRPA